ncbi:MAG: phosphatidylglycerol lysyltransferase domain-containing protein [Thermodesulfovibrionales bacterium]|nr:phosphatidylglycerol lysyltransferase domain-containing protein [Thermodesulfovibrionales bacterium]
MTIEPLTLKHKETLKPLLKSIGSPISEYSFANLYLFRGVHQYKVIVEDEIFISGITYDRQTYLMPTFKVTKEKVSILTKKMSGFDCLFPIDESWLQHFDPEVFDFSLKEGDMDYVYYSDKMKTYRGRRLHKKRNLMKQFLESYNHVEFGLTKDKIPDALTILDAWQIDSGLNTEQTDYEPCKEALTLNDELCLCGIIYYAEDEPAGFILGEELNTETFVLHFVKAKKKFKGIYQYMYNSFANLLPTRYKYLNYEQDLDKEALRLAKSSYLPDIMIKKYRVSLKKGD